VSIFGPSSHSSVWLTFLEERSDDAFLGIAPVKFSGLGIGGAPTQAGRRSPK
jgi:hypothetical protein